MNEFSGKWKQFRGEIQKKWGELTNDDMDKAEGSWDAFVGRLQERYGKSRKEADEEARSFFAKLAS